MFIALLAITLLPAVPVLASQRVVVAEDFTATWCTWCPDAMRAIDSIYKVAEDTFVIIAYHPSSSDPFYNQVSIDRANYYNLMYYPTVFFGGDLDTNAKLVGSFGTSTYDSCRIRYDSIKVLPSPYEIYMSVNSFNDAARSCQVDVKVKNTSGTVQSGDLQFLVLERRIQYPWQTMSELDFLVRDMLPDAQGQNINLAAGDSITVSRTVNLQPSWIFGGCDYVAFIQGSDRDINQASEIRCRQSLIQKRYAITESGNGNGFYEPAETLKCAVYTQELFASGTGAKVTAWTPDTFVTVANPVWDIGSIAEGDSADNAADPFRVIVEPNATMNEGHPVKVYLTKQVYNDLYQDTVSHTDSINFLVGSPVTIYTEGFETGRSNWADSGVGGGVDWDTTSAEAHSGGVCITDSKAGNYANSQSRYIWMINGVDLTGMSSAVVTWYEKYNVLANDYCRPEYSVNGSATFSSLISPYNGSLGSWQQRSVNITSYCNTTNFRLRYRLTSNSVDVADGWQVDDIAITGYYKTGVSGQPGELTRPVRPLLFNCAPNPFRSGTEIRYQISSAQNVRLAVYDITGRLVKTLVSGIQVPGAYQVNWDGLDERGRQAPNGVYLYSLKAGTAVSTKNMVLVR
jgi:thiol-disulfide isomerase/thioredoxin